MRLFLFLCATPCPYAAALLSTRLVAFALVSLSRRKRSSYGLKPLTNTGQELQVEIWDREAGFESLVHEAARVAKQRHVSIDLFKYGALSSVCISSPLIEITFA